MEAVSEHDLDRLLSTLAKSVQAVDAAMVPAVVTQLGAIVVMAGARMALRAPGPTPAAGRVTQEAAAEHEGIALAVVRHLTRSGRVPSVKEGKARKLLLADLRRYVAYCQAHGLPLRHGPLADGLLPAVTSAA